MSGPELKARKLNIKEALRTSNVMAELLKLKVAIAVNTKECSCCKGQIRVCKTIAKA